jgi:hypothetical protein
MRLSRGYAALFLVTLLASCTSSSPTAKPTPTIAFADMTAKQVMQTALDAARAQSSFRMVSRGTARGGSITFVNDVAARRGNQMITSGGQRARIIVIDDVAYLRANLAALRGFFDVPASLASRMAGKWISFVPSDPPYQEVAETVTLDSALEDLKLSGRLQRAGQKTIEGQRVVVITGTALDKSKGTLYVSTEGNHLPVEEVTTNGTRTVVFSRWAQSVTVDSPPNALPYSNLVGTPSPSSGPFV